MNSKVRSWDADWDAKWIAESLAVPLSIVAKQRWITVFEDNSSPRPGTRDVYFERDQNISKHLPPIIIVKWKPRPLYIELVMLAFGVLAIGSGWLVSRKRPRR